MNLKYLKQFKDLADFIEYSKPLSLNQYAIEKGLVLSQMSRVISELEKEYGVSLLIRESQSLKLSKNGLKLAQKIPFIFMEIDNTFQYVTLDEELERGVFDLHTTSFLMDYWLAPKLTDFKRKHPRITLNLFHRDESLFTPHEKQTLLTIGAKTEEDAGYEQVHLKDFHIGLWASKEYLEKNGIPEQPSDLSRNRLICFQRDWPEHAYPSMNWYINNNDFALNSDNIVVIRSSIGIMKAAQSGLGIFSLSQESINAMGLKFERVLPDYPGPIIPMCFSYPSLWKEHRSIQAIKDFLIQSFNENS